MSCRVYYFFLDGLAWARLRPAALGRSRRLYLLEPVKHADVASSCLTGAMVPPQPGFCNQQHELCALMVHAAIVLSIRCATRTRSALT